MSEIIKLSRSTVEKYLSCPRCCVLDKKYKMISPINYPTKPFSLRMDGITVFPVGPSRRYLL